MREFIKSLRNLFGHLSYVHETKMGNKLQSNCVRTQNGPPKIWLFEKDAGYDPPDIFILSKVS